MTSPVSHTQNVPTDLMTTNQFWVDAPSVSHQLTNYLAQRWHETHPWNFIKPVFRCLCANFSLLVLWRLFKGWLGGLGTSPRVFTVLHNVLLIFGRPYVPSLTHSLECLCHLNLQFGNIPCRQLPQLISLVFPSVLTQSTKILYSLAATIHTFFIFLRSTCGCKHGCNSSTIGTSKTHFLAHVYLLRNINFQNERASTWLLDKCLRNSGFWRKIFFLLFLKVDKWHRRFNRP